MGLFGSKKEKEPVVPQTMKCPHCEATIRESDECMVDNKPGIYEMRIYNDYLDSYAIACSTCKKVLSITHNY